MIKHYNSSNTQVRNTILGYLRGVEEALIFANATLKKRGDTQFNCQLGGLVLHVEQIVSILEDYVTEFPFAEDRPASLILLAAFEKTFPCT
ncbi:Rap1a/Tai family immunity protein [Ruegeria sp. Ofav3-42]|uniref:Rap1a/Tai family immunity protein n=1 Tax=Ruegeria sp. Ofav3-42 TaxID=2917759 RepID=UPI00351CC039